MERIVTVILTALLAVAIGCDFPAPSGDGVGHAPVYQTKILDVLVEPDPVAIGDTALFTVIIRDSLDTRFRFTWNGSGLDRRVTEARTIEWIAPGPPGYYSFSVRADDGTPISQEIPPTQGFVVLVVEAH